MCLGLKVEADVDYQKTDQYHFWVSTKTRSSTGDFERVDKLRAELKAQGIVVKDMKDKIEWAFEE